jgi:hypothetical protein
MKEKNSLLVLDFSFCVETKQVFSSFQRNGVRNYFYVMLLSSICKRNHINTIKITHKHTDVPIIHILPHVQSTTSCNAESSILQLLNISPSFDSAITNDGLNRIDYLSLSRHLGLYEESRTSIMVSHIKKHLPRYATSCKAIPLLEEGH